MARLADNQARARILARIDRLAVGNSGDSKLLRGGVSELRIDWGPGYRVYYAMIGKTCVLLLCGGDKRKQSSDVEREIEYLRAALEDEDEPRVLLVALRRIAEARGGIAKVAKAAGVERESLYRALSAHGNPRLSTLAAVTKAMGLKLTVEAWQ